MAKAPGRILIGTSGWSYDHWLGPFYPADLPGGDRLAFYAGHFPGVEINNSFYRLPAARTLRQWHDAVPPDFLFSAKASRYVTHMKKLRDPEEGLATFLERISLLEEKLGPILFQLPPRWRFNAQRLATFLDALSREFRYAFEFRDPSWLTDQTYALLARHEAALCLYDLDGFASPRELTTDLVYVRLHGPDGPYEGSYDARALSGWAQALSGWAVQGREVHCYFDNDQAGYAPRNALSLLSLIERHAAQP